MSANTIFVGLELLLQLIDRIATTANVIKVAQSEGRDVTSAELATLRAEGDAALAALDDAIAMAKAEGR